MKEGENEKRRKELQGTAGDRREMEDERLRLGYERALEEIEDADDENARDNLSDYMDELREESENVGRPSGKE